MARKNAVRIRVKTRPVGKGIRVATRINVNGKSKTTVKTYR